MTETERKILTIYLQDLGRSAAMTIPAPAPGALVAPAHRRARPAAAVAAVFVGANAHLIAVAFASKPDCVAHLKLRSRGPRPIARRNHHAERPRRRPPPPDNPHAAGVIPKVVPPLPRENPHARDLPWRTAFAWLRAGWSDLWTNPLPSLLYGLGVFALSALVVWSLFRFELDYFLFPALAGFLVVGPLIAGGLYEKSRRLEAGERVSLVSMVFVRMRSGPRRSSWACCCWGCSCCGCAPRS